MQADDPWPEAQIKRLHELWAHEELSTTAIGRALGKSKNAVVGKARREGLPPRPSPIIRRPDGPRPPRIPRAPRSTIPPLACVAAPAATPARTTPPAPVAPAIRKPAPVIVAAPPPPVRRTPCCWPIGEPGRPGFRFCDEPSDGRTPYCAPHAAQAYEPRPERDRLDRRLLRKLPAYG